MVPESFTVLSFERSGSFTTSLAKAINWLISLILGRLGGLRDPASDSFNSSSSLEISGIRTKVSFGVSFCFAGSINVTVAKNCGVTIKFLALRQVDYWLVDI